MKIMYGTVGEEGDLVRWWYELEGRHGTLASGSFIALYEPNEFDARGICEDILAAAGGRGYPIRDDGVAEWQEDQLRERSRGR